MEENLHSRKLKLEKEDKKAKKSRRRERQGLFALRRPPLTASLKSSETGIPTSTRFGAVRSYIENSLFGAKECSAPPTSVNADDVSVCEGDEDDEDDDGEEAGPRRRFRPARRIRSIDTLLHLLNLPQNSLKADRHGRVKAEDKLGQYLLEAVRLFEGMTNFRDKTLVEQYLVTDDPIHPRRTLDQAYYTRARDKDQVVYRATTAPAAKFRQWHSKERNWKENVTRDPEISDRSNCRECTEDIKMLSRVIMLDQIWMWILDSQTISICSPRHYGANKHAKSGIRKSIRVRLGEERH